jgi:hypothetical protein
VQTDRRELVIHLVLGVCSGLAMAYAAYSFIVPLKGVPLLFPFQDKVFHFLAFAGLTGPAVLVLPPRYMWFWIAHMVMLGAGIEIVQQLWLGPYGRSGSLTDLVADYSGIAVAFAVARAIRSRFETQSNSPVT